MYFNELMEFKIIVILNVFMKITIILHVIYKNLINYLKIHALVKIFKLDF